jgi:hypothetical protein
MSFEIIIFENQDLYDGSNEIEDEKQAVKEFLDYCKKYFEYYFKGNLTLTIGTLYVSYADDSGGDKPLNILLIGKLTQESKDQIKSQLSSIYLNQ